jgi:hypothetical protein
VPIEMLFAWMVLAFSITFLAFLSAGFVVAVGIAEGIAVECCCFIAVALLLHCCCIAVALLLHCCCVSVALLLHCCCVAVGVAAGVCYLRCCWRCSLNCY